MSEEIKLKVGNTYILNDGKSQCQIIRCDSSSKREDEQDCDEKIFTDHLGIQYFENGQRCASAIRQYSIAEKIGDWEKEVSDEFSIEVGKIYEHDEDHESVRIECEWLGRSQNFDFILLLGSNGAVYRKDGTCVLFAERGSWDLLKEVQ